MSHHNHPQEADQRHAKTHAFEPTTQMRTQTPAVKDETTEEGRLSDIKAALGKNDPKAQPQARHSVHCESRDVPPSPNQAQEPDTHLPQETTEGQGIPPPAGPKDDHQSPFISITLLTPPLAPAHRLYLDILFRLKETK